MNSIRTCIACRKKGNKQDFLRIVARDGIAAMDENKKENTRGVYICNCKECITRLLKAKVSGESLKELLKNLGE